tara:strand:+ start:225 stop:428 length:204 start_codon:yes stop_codon:yes gene_type:complete
MEIRGLNDMKPEKIEALTWKRKFFINDLAFATNETWGLFLNKLGITEDTGTINGVEIETKVHSIHKD